MMAERVRKLSLLVAVFIVLHGAEQLGAGGNSLVDKPLGIIYEEADVCSVSPQGQGFEQAVAGSFLPDMEQDTVDGQLGNMYRAVGIAPALNLDSAECFLVEFNSCGAITDAELGSEEGRHMAGDW